jgi:hypothetical protein
METLMGILTSTYETTMTTVVAYAPQVLATLVLVVAGLVLARAARAAVFAIFEALKVDDVAAKIGANNALKRADVGLSTSQIVAQLVYWTFLVFTASVALSTLGFADAGTFKGLAAMVPNVVIAAFVMVLGINVSAFLSKVIQTAAVNAEVRQARLVRNVSHYGMSTLVTILALRQLGVPEELLSQGFLILFAGMTAGLALAFGLGCRELAGDIASHVWESEVKQSHNLAAASELGRQIFPSIKLSSSSNKTAASRAKSAA